MLGAGNITESKTDKDPFFTGTHRESDIKLTVTDKHICVCVCVCVCIHTHIYIYISCYECYEEKVENNLRKLVGSLV